MMYSETEYINLFLRRDSFWSDFKKIFDIILIFLKFTIATVEYM